MPVLAKVWLDEPVYAQLYAHAQQRDTDVPGLLARLATASLKPIERTGYVRITEQHVDEAIILREHGYSWREIANKLHLGSGPAIRNRVNARLKETHT